MKFSLRHWRTCCEFQLGCLVFPHQRRNSSNRRDDNSDDERSIVYHWKEENEDRVRNEKRNWLSFGWPDGFLITYENSTQQLQRLRRDQVDILSRQIHSPLERAWTREPWSKQWRSIIERGRSSFTSMNRTSKRRFAMVFRWLTEFQQLNARYRILVGVFDHQFHRFFASFRLNEDLWGDETNVVRSNNAVVAAYLNFFDEFVIRFFKGEISIDLFDQQNWIERFLSAQQIHRITLLTPIGHLKTISWIIRWTSPRSSSSVLTCLLRQILH